MLGRIDMKIRKVKEEDLKECSRLIQRNIERNWSKDYPKEAIESWKKRYSEKELRNMLEEEELFLAEENNLILGTIFFHGNQVKGLFVREKYQGKGIGTKLLQKIEEMAKKRKLKELYLNSSIPALKFYIKRGYKKIKRDNEDKLKRDKIRCECIKMVKKLNETNK